MATTKQKRAFDEIGVNGGNITKAMKVAGYSKEVAKRTDKLINTKGWKELMDKHLPDDLLAKKHREGLEATTKKPQLVGRDDKGRPVYEYIPEEDYAVRHKYLETAYKIKGKKMGEGESENTKTVVAVQVIINGTDHAQNRTDEKAV